MQSLGAVYIDMDNLAIDLTSIPIHEDIYAFVEVQSIRHPIMLAARIQPIHIDSLIHRLRATFDIELEEVKDGSIGKVASYQFSFGSAGEQPKKGLTY